MRKNFSDSHLILFAMYNTNKFYAIDNSKTKYEQGIFIYFMYLKYHLIIIL